MMNERSFLKEMVIKMSVFNNNNVRLGYGTGAIEHEISLGNNYYITALFCDDGVEIYALHNDWEFGYALIRDTDGTEYELTQREWERNYDEYMGDPYETVLKK